MQVHTFKRISDTLQVSLTFMFLSKGHEIFYGMSYNSFYLPNSSSTWVSKSCCFKKNVVKATFLGHQVFYCLHAVVPGKQNIFLMDCSISTIITFMSLYQNCILLLCSLPIRHYHALVVTKLPKGLLQGLSAYQHSIGNIPLKTTVIHVTEKQ